MFTVGILPARDCSYTQDGGTPSTLAPARHSAVAPSSTDILRDTTDDLVPPDERLWANRGSLRRVRPLLLVGGTSPSTEARGPTWARSARPRDEPEQARGPRRITLAPAASEFLRPRRRSSGRRGRPAIPPIGKVPAWRRSASVSYTEALVEHGLGFNAVVEVAFVLSGSEVAETAACLEGGSRAPGACGGRSVETTRERKGA